MRAHRHAGPVAGADTGADARADARPGLDVLVQLHRDRRAAQFGEFVLHRQQADAGGLAARALRASRRAACSAAGCAPRTTAALAGSGFASLGLGFDLGFSIGCRLLRGLPRPSWPVPAGGGFALEQQLGHRGGSAPAGSGPPAAPGSTAATSSAPAAQHAEHALAGCAGSAASSSAKSDHGRTPRGKLTWNAARVASACIRHASPTSAAPRTTRR